MNAHQLIRMVAIEHRPVDRDALLNAIRSDREGPALGTAWAAELDRLADAVAGWSDAQVAQALRHAVSPQYPR